MRDVIGIILAVVFLIFLLEPESLGRLVARVALGFGGVMGYAP